MEDSFQLQIIADDLGYCPERDRGIFSLFESGFITSSSIMANGSNSVRAAAKSLDDGMTVGLHFNITEGKPLSLSDRVSSLVDAGGNFLGKFGLRQKLLCGLISVADIETEVAAQIEWFIQHLGISPQRIDGHQHTHILPGVREPLVNVLKQYSVQETRVPYEKGLHECEWIDSKRKEFYNTVCKDAVTAGALFAAENIGFPKHFIGLSVMGKDMSVQRITRCLNLIKEDHNGSPSHSPACPIDVELMVHPGFQSRNGHGGCDGQPDEFSLSTDREYEMEILKSDAFRDCLQHHNVVFGNIEPRNC